MKKATRTRDQGLREYISEICSARRGGRPYLIGTAILLSRKTLKGIEVIRIVCGSNNDRTHLRQ